MIKKLLIVAVILFLKTPAICDSILIKQSPSKYRITTKLTVNASDINIAKAIAVIPLPTTNVYQSVSDIQPGIGKIKDVPASNDKYVVYTINKGNSLEEFVCNYTVTIYDIKTDLNKISNIMEYDKQSADFIWNTGSNGELIDINNPVIIAAAKDLWEKNPSLLGYARACYEYASKFKYLDPNTGIHPLKKILKDGGGDCGNLSSIFVSLMRAKGIPARHLVSIRPDGSWHIWADFYMQGYGWIPVDPTYKHNNPKGDYFGKVSIKTNGIILSTKLNIPLDVGGSQTKIIDLLQTYFYLYWGTGKGNISADFSFTGKQIKD